MTYDSGGADVRKGKKTEVAHALPSLYIVVVACRCAQVVANMATLSLARCC